MQRDVEKLDSEYKGNSDVAGRTQAKLEKEKHRSDNYSSLCIFHVIHVNLNVLKSNVDFKSKNEKKFAFLKEIAKLNRFQSQSNRSTSQ